MMKHIFIFIILTCCMHFAYSGISVPGKQKTADKSSIFSSESIFIEISNSKISPVIDGIPDDKCWNKVLPQTIILKRHRESITATVKACKTDDMIFFMIQYKIEQPSRKHKYWHWNSRNNIYMPGPEREESFQLRFSKEMKNEDTSDIWIWRSARTDPSGNADDMFFSKGAYKMDKGRHCWFSKFFGDFAGDKLPRFYQRIPNGSAADVKAKGIWKKNTLTIEFSRKLNTGNKDDIDMSDKLFVRLIRGAEEQ